MKKLRFKRYLIVYDILAFLALFFAFFSIQNGWEAISRTGVFIQASLSLACVLLSRILCRIYRQIWRYGGIQCYMRLLISDGIAFLVNFALEKLLPIEHIRGSFILIVISVNLLFSLAMRMFYRYAYKCADNHTLFGRLLRLCLRIFAGIGSCGEDEAEETEKTGIAIIGAGRIGVVLAEDLRSSHTGMYDPRCFVDISQDKINRSILGIPVLREDDAVFDRLREMGIRDAVLAIADMDDEKKRGLYEKYLTAGFRVKVYDYPLMQSVGGKRQVRDFDIEELLFRKPIIIHNEKTEAYYKGKTVMITGGGGSIGSELCRQLAKMLPSKIIIVDIYENGAYDVQQELRIAYGTALDLRVEIASITSRRAMARIFKEYRPDIVINAAAHKHVPLMENNCIEAVENNVFGTKVLIELCEEYESDSFVMVSTDKAVNPTNVMGATKRMCEMLVRSASTHGSVKYSATRFGNVLGSAGSVIPLFKRQIANGGPITVTDKRIIRYFMTIPEAAQLVLESGAIAKNGELFVLDMGQPVKIYDLAKNMIRLSGASGIEIVETGLRPGEKLYEELLVQTDKLEKTENSLIFIEHDVPLSRSEIDEKLALLSSAVETDSDENVRRALKLAVPTFVSPDEVNREAL